VPVLPEANYEACDPLRPIDLSWPFAVWGIDIVGALPMAPGRFMFLFVDIDTFTK
jgi:transposase InsO family protein